MSHESASARAVTKGGCRWAELEDFEEVMLGEQQTPEAKLLVKHYVGSFLAQPPERLGGVKTTLTNYLKYFTDPIYRRAFLRIEIEF